MQIAKRRAFTIIELLVVTAIAAILYSLVLPIMPKSLTRQTSISLQEAIDKLQNMRSDQKAELSFACKNSDECGFFEGDKMIEDGYRIAVKKGGAIEEFEKSIEGKLSKKYRESGEPEILIKLNRYGVVMPAVYFFDDAFFVIGGVAKIRVADTKTLAEQYAFGAYNLAFSDEQFAK